MKVEYDIEKEMKNIKKKSDKILAKYPGINGLESVLDDTLALYDSEPFILLTRNLDKYVNDFDKVDIWDEMDVESIKNGNIDSISKEFQFLKYIKILKVSNPNFLRAFGFGDPIIFAHFTNFISFNVGLLKMKKKEDLSYSEVLGLTNKIMSSLENFNNIATYDSTDKEFFTRLKYIKLDKKSRKLINKIFSLQGNIISLIIVELFSNLIGNIFGNYFGVLEMLTACSAVNRGSDRMEYEDVICAFNTFYKLINADINDLI